MYKAKVKTKFNMDNRITFKQYRNIDLGILCVVTVVFEAIATLASSRWFAGQPMAISLTLLLTLIAMHRWGPFAAVIAVVGGAVFCISSSASPEHFLIYCVGNLFALSSLLYFKLFGKESVRRSFFKTLLYASSAYVMTALGRYLSSLPFGGGFAELVGFVASDVLSLLIAVIVLYALRDMDGLIEDQKAYLFRLEKQRQADTDGE